MPKNINLYFLNSEEKISNSQKKKLKKEILKQAQIAMKVLDLDLLNITIYPKSSWAIPQTGLNGYAPSENWVQLTVDVKNKFKKFNWIINNSLPSTVCHEINHCARWKYIGYGNTLAEAIVSEGLASLFEIEMCKKYKVPWLKITKKEGLDIIKIFNKRNKNKDSFYNHNEWFFGEGKLPKWIGYKLGFYFINLFKKNNLEIKWKDLMKLPANKFINIQK